MYANIVAGIGILIILLTGAVAFYGAALAPAVIPTATSTIVVVESPKAPEIAEEEPSPAPAVEEAAEPALKTEPVQKPAVAPTKTVAVAKVPIVQAPPPPQPTQSEFDTGASQLRGALVNILCLSGRRDIPSISGSGVFVDAKGYILTNAHIAQYFLYTGDPSLEVSCTIRAGSPANNAYKASLIFISPQWVSANAKILATENPTGNGEYDFAFLGVTGSASSAALPPAFPAIALGEGSAYKDEPVIIGGYAAQFLTSSEIRSSLYPTLVFGSIKAIFTFTEHTVDVITLGGSAAAQEGSSGGGVARASGVLAGIITTSTTEGMTADRTLGGITSSYIRREYEKQSGITLENLFAKSPTEAASDFSPQIANLRATLIAPLTH